MMLLTRTRFVRSGQSIEFQQSIEQIISTEDVTFFRSEEYSNRVTLCLSKFHGIGLEHERCHIARRTPQIYFRPARK